LNIVLLGPPGAGKGTQAKVLSKEFGLLHISTGDMLRNAAKRGDGIGKKAAGYIERGELVPDEIVVSLVVSRISQKDAEKGFMLDGFPRNTKQADILSLALEQKNKKLDLVLYFSTSEKVSVERLSGRRVCRKCGSNYHVKNMPPKKEGICDACGGELYQRPDDKEETVKNRLKVYDKETKSLIDYYRSQGLLREINGDMEVGDLFGVIKAIFVKEGLDG